MKDQLNLPINTPVYFYLVRMHGLGHHLWLWSFTQLEHDALREKLDAWESAWHEWYSDYARAEERYWEEAEKSLGSVENVPAFALTPDSFAGWKAILHEIPDMIELDLRKKELQRGHGGLFVMQADSIMHRLANEKEMHDPQHFSSRFQFFADEVM